MYATFSISDFLSLGGRRKEEGGGWSEIGTFLTSFAVWDKEGRIRLPWY